MDEQNNMNMPQEGGSKGSLIGIIVIILIIILGGLYFWSQRSDTVEIPENNSAQGGVDPADAVGAEATFPADSEDSDMMDTDLEMEINAS